MRFYFACLVWVGYVWLLFVLLWLYLCAASYVFVGSILIWFSLFDVAWVLCYLCCLFVCYLFVCYFVCLDCCFGICVTFLNLYCLRYTNMYFVLVIILCCVGYLFDSFSCCVCVILLCVHVCLIRLFSTCLASGLYFVTGAWVCFDLFTFTLMFVWVLLGCI